jgi:hypothetical protein
MATASMGAKTAKMAEERTYPFPIILVGKILRNHHQVNVAAFTLGAGTVGANRMIFWGLILSASNAFQNHG